MISNSFDFTESLRFVSSKKKCNFDDVSKIGYFRSPWNKVF